MTRTRSGSVHFSITGEAFTRLAREMFLSERPDKAYRFVTQGLGGGSDGEAAALAPRLLDGTKCLIGDESGMEAADDPDATEYRARVRWLYAGRINVQGFWYRPCAVVTSGGTDDAWYATKNNGGMCPSPVINPSDFERWSQKRAAYYGKEGAGT